jgi:hypothetical protein
MPRRTFHELRASGNILKINIFFNSLSGNWWGKSLKNDIENCQISRQSSVKLIWKFQHQHLGNLWGVQNFARFFKEAITFIQI